MKRGSRRHYIAFTGMFCIFSSSCEAPLELGGVEASERGAVHRTDSFQDVVIGPDAAIFVGGGGVVVEMPLEGGASTRAVVGDAALGPDLIDAAVCRDGSVFALDLTGGVWRREASGQWSPRRIDTMETVQSLACAPDDRLWVSASFATLYSSADGGESWDETSFDDDLILTSVEFPGADAGVAIGEFSALIRSQDGGESWENLETAPSDFYPLASYFSTPQTGWISGLGGEIYATRDGGLSWELEPTSTDAPLYRIAKIGGELYAAGNFGVVLRRRGERWADADLDIGSFGYLRALAGTDAEIFIGGQGMARRVARNPAS